MRPLSLVQLTLGFLALAILLLPFIAPHEPRDVGTYTPPRNELPVR